VYKCMSCLKRTLCCRWQVAGECRAMVCSKWPALNNHWV
jgi:hypothetical protein